MYIHAKLPTHISKHARKQPSKQASQKASNINPPTCIPTYERVYRRRDRQTASRSQPGRQTDQMSMYTHAFVWIPKRGHVHACMLHASVCTSVCIPVYTQMMHM